MKKTLVIDDEKIICSAFKKVLGEAGYEIDSVLDGETALEKVKSKKYDFIFIDMILPGNMNGIQTCRAIKKINTDVVAVFMTGKLDEDTACKELDFIEAGGKVYYLYKPFGSGEILEITKKALMESD